MVENAQVAADDLVLKGGAGGDVDAVAVIGHDNDRAAERYALAERDIARDCEMVQIHDVRDALEPRQELVDLLKVLVAKLDERRVGEGAGRVHDQRAVLNGVQVGLDNEQVRARLDGQEARARDVNAACALEVLDARTHGLFQLDHLGPIVQRLHTNEISILFVHVDEFALPTTKRSP